MKEYSLGTNEPDENFLVEEPSGKYQDLEERCLKNALRVRNLVKKADLSIWNIEYIKQVVRSSGSVGANYIEANEYLGDKDFLMKAKISRREAKETKYWLQLLDLEGKPDLDAECKNLINEAEELRRIFSAIITKRTENLKQK